MGEFSYSVRQAYAKASATSRLVRHPPVRAAGASRKRPYPKPERSDGKFGRF